MTAALRLALLSAWMAIPGCGSPYLIGNQVIATMASAGMASDRVWRVADQGRERKILDDARARPTATRASS